MLNQFIKSHQHSRLLKCELNKEDTNGYAEEARETPTRSQPYSRNHRQRRKAGSRAVDLPKEEHSSLYLGYQRVSPENIYTSNIIRTGNI